MEGRLRIAAEGWWQQIRRLCLFDAKGLGDGAPDPPSSGGVARSDSGRPLASRVLYEFIEQGNRVKVSVRFRGRQMAYQERGRELLRGLAVKLKDVAIVDQEPKMEGREMSLILNPAKS